MKALLVGIAILGFAASIGYGQEQLVKEPIRYKFDRIRGDTVIYAADIYSVNSQKNPPTYRYELKAIWQYDLKNKKWQKLNLINNQATLLFDESTRVYLLEKDLLKQHVSIGLYYCVTSINGKMESDLVFHGPVLCNDVMIGNPPQGMIATCVPFPNSAKAMFVPDPKELRSDSDDNEK